MKKNPTFVKIIIYTIFSKIEMKRVLTILVLLAVALGVQAQTPRLVLRSVVDMDRVKAVERLDLINIKTRNEMPEMYILAEAAVMCMGEQNIDTLMMGYELLAQNIHDIRKSKHLETVFKGNGITLDQIILQIENDTYAAVCDHNTEELYRKYLDMAERGDHSNVAAIRESVERAAYENTMQQRSVEACDKFTSEFPNSDFTTSVATHRAELLYASIMNTTSTKEGEMEQFIIDYPDYPHIISVKTRLMDIRYERVRRNRSLEEMRWFVELYPQHSEVPRLKQTMANKEYPTIPDTREALEGFLSYYPATHQVGEVMARIRMFQMIERADLVEIFDYIKANGYNRHYTRMQRSIAQKHGYLILTDDINAVSLIRFRNRDGKVGYMDHSGKIVVEPKYDFCGPADMNAYSDKAVSDIYECLKSRNLAIVVHDGKYGVINSDGREIIPTIYARVSFKVGEIACENADENDSSDNLFDASYYCTSYDYSGKILGEGERYVTGLEEIVSNYWDISWFNSDLKIMLRDTHEQYLKDLWVNGEIRNRVYGGFHYLTDDYRWYQVKDDDKLYVITRGGEVFRLTFHYYGVDIIYGNVIVAESISSGNRCVIDLDKRSIISQDKFRNVYPMSDDMILVQYVDNHFGYVNKGFSDAIAEHYDRAYSFSCGIAAVMKGGEGYLIDKSGKQVSKSYDEIAPLAGHRGLYKVSKDGLCGVIDCNDDVVVPIKYKPATRAGRYASDSLTPIQSVGGLINWGDGQQSYIFAE